MPRVRLGHRALREACAPQCPPSQDPRHPAVAGPLARPRLAALPRPLVRSMPLAVFQMRAPGRCRISGWGRVSGCLCVYFCVHCPPHTHHHHHHHHAHTHTHTPTRTFIQVPRVLRVSVMCLLCFGWYLCFGCCCLRSGSSPRILVLLCHGYFCVSGCCCLRSSSFLSAHVGTSVSQSAAVSAPAASSPCAAVSAPAASSPRIWVLLSQGAAVSAPAASSPRMWVLLCLRVLLSPIPLLQLSARMCTSVSWVLLCHSRN